MTYFMGIDIGSGTSKGVITKDGRLEAYHLLASGVNYRMTVQKLVEELLVKAGLAAKDIAYVVATGHNVSLAPFDNQHVADMRCCAKGINRIFPPVRTVIDVQRETSQVIRLDEKGEVTDFAVSEVCAGGSGYFLEVISNVLQLELKDIGPLSLRSENPVTFTTGCAVFGESEAISRVAEGTPPQDILAGVHKTLAGKILSLVSRVKLEEQCAISGGGGLNVGLTKRLEGTGLHLLVPPQPQLTNALGAAIIAEQRFG
jgi:predicted CoA-substrate-specific enzyme activase